MGSQDSGLRPATGINHVAFRCRDAEQTRWFYGDVLGLPLSAALVSEKVPGLGDEIPYMHLFFELGNGEFIAFFDQPETAEPGQFERAHSFDRHVAFEVPDEQALLQWQARINSKGVSCLGPVDHGFVKSVYMYDPNGLQVELTYRTEKFAPVLAGAGRQADASMAEWTARYRDLKLRKFGASAIDRRSRHAG
jgi:catechol 2,3-dioxygenase-like lactoylglutathione lyase family enzyme